MKITSAKDAPRCPLIPRCVAKYQLKNYFGQDYRYIWRNLITDDLLEEWGSSREEVNRVQVLPPDLTKKIYTHFRITDLNADFSDEIAEAISDYESI